MAGADSTTADHPTFYSEIPSCSNNKLYKGVRKRKWGKWVSEIRLPNSRERIWLGSYDGPEKAARAFDAALYCLRGRHASFNFPDTPFNLDQITNNVADQSLTHQEIQVVAAKFANDMQHEDPPRDTRESSGLSQLAANSFELCKSNSVTESTYTTTTTTSSSSSSSYEYDRTVQVDQGDMMAVDWTFLNVLNDSNEVAASDCDLYYGLDKMHSGELFYSNPPPPPFEDNGDEIEGDDAFSHHSFLWNWNF